MPDTPQLPTILSASIGDLEFSFFPSLLRPDGNSLILVAIRDEKSPQTTTTRLPLQDLKKLVDIITRLNEEFCEDYDPLEM
jgi:hypothetical protein